MSYEFSKAVEMMWINLALLAAWLMLNGINSLSTHTLAVGRLNDPDPYPVFRFNTLSDNPRASYRELIGGIRDLLADNEIGPVFEIPRLSPRASVAKSRWFLQVELINSNEDTITCVLNTINLYLVGYRTGNKFYYFSDTADGVDTLFPKLPHYVLPFLSSYGGLAQEAGDRGKIALGIAPLEQAIDDLQEYRRRDLARAFTVIIQMFPEAIRYKYIEDFIGTIIRRQVQDVPSGTMIDLENEWGSLSTRIQNSIDGTISPPVVITNREGKKTSISTVTTGLVVNIGILFFVCIRTSNAEIILTTAPLHTDGATFTSISEPIIRHPVGKGSRDRDTCNKTGEPTVHIVGRNGLCATVKDGTYSDGNPIVLSPCKSNEDVNQLWTLKADGTIISRGMCLATNGDSSPGVMLVNCKAALPVVTKWEVLVNNGTIKNPRSSLVLSATSGSMGTQLTLQENLYSTSETWVVANNTQPIITPIMNTGQFNMCLQATGAEISYSKCQSGETRQIFAVYPDGSIRPNDKRDDCLAVNNSRNLVVVAGCNGSAEQRWSFNRDYTISNLDTGLIIDALNNFIYLSISSVPRGTQEWQAWLL
ncbi:hypothetical protein POM88_036675 [Heracleum sosnowskyi]|uniref:Ribosome-inactivating protein n=1 Tax=Heracleum sosnowskyi TaxID=360622 RepID=A0AAD8HPN6_9APIA|nr:hypothetical protein POM88_036675 [Heracleum sosnowskyi]